MRPSIGFIGLGVMGGPMARHLAAKGFATTVYNRSPQRLAKWLEGNSAQVAKTPSEVAKNANFVISCVGNDDDLKEVTLGPNGALQSMPSGSIYIDHSTTSADVAREVAEHASRHDVFFLDAPVSGGQAGAEQGALSVMCGGEQQAFDIAKPVLSTYAKACTLMGPVGSGQLTKMVNQICIAGLLQGLSEGLNFGLQAGLNMEAVIDVISKGAAQSWQLENRGKTMCRDEFDFGFAVELMRKDLGIVIAEAKRQHASLPVTELVDTFYAELQSQGFHRADTSSLIKLLRATT